MSSTVRNGFSTLNRLLGKKNKDGSMSKSVSNLSTLDTTSQHNKIIPLAASTNAPFEQTFRITISLPKDQLFVVRVGAKTKLRQLLETVCVSKQLDRDKYEFRHPDGTQTYDNEMTIGEVGLNEIRLADKNDKTYIKFNTDELMKLRHLSRESLTSSSDFSKGSNKQSVYSKTISPYSSTNSLNSMDSATGMNPAHRNYSHNRASLPHPPVAPQRKKRVAPRPPSQNSINENTIVEHSHNGNGDFKKPLPMAMPRQAFHASTPNLNGVNGNNNESKFSVYNKIHNNNNNEHTHNNNNTNEQQVNGNRTSSVTDLRLRQPAALPDDTVEPSPIYATVELRKSRTSSESSDLPTPKRRTFVAAANRKKAPPAPTPRLVIPVTATTVTAATTIAEEVIAVNNIAPQSPPPETKQHNQIHTVTNSNISKVMLNVEQPTKIIEIDSRDLSSIGSLSPVATTDEPPSLDSKSGADSSDDEKTNIYNIRTGKPIIVQPPVASANTKSTITQINQQTATVTEVISGEDTSKESSPIRLVVETPKSPVNKSLTGIRDASEPSSRAESPLWTYTLPAPLKFADTEHAGKNQTIASTDLPGFYNGESAAGSSDTATVISDLSDMSDVPIRPIIKERLPLDFQVFTDSSTICEDVQSVSPSDVEDGYQGFSQRFSREALLESLEKRRDQFIENEFKFLTTEDSTLGSEPQSLKMDTTAEDEDVDHQASEQPIQKATPDMSQVELQRRFSDESTKSNVIEELKDVIVNNKLDDIIKTNGHNEPISTENALSNFSINTYSNEITESNVANTNQHSIETVTLVSNIVEDENVINQADIPEKENQFVKRPSLTSSISPHSSPVRINRADSFHSTRQPNLPADISNAPITVLTPRSSSYISLIGTQKYENRTLRSQYSDSSNRRSSSELSIADSPSLQSLSVMKSILSNSRKNSLNSEAISAAAESSLRKETEEKVVLRNTSITDINRSTVEPLAIQETILQPVKSAANVTITKLNTEPPAAIPVAAEKKWSYQGPPAINMSTWGERPKSKISIKTDKDYKSSDTVKGNDKPTVVNPVIRTGFKDDSITTKSPDTDRTPIIRGVVPKLVTQVPDLFDTETSNISIRRPSYEISTYITEKPQPETTSISSASITLGRVPIPNRWSTIGTVRTSATNLNTSLSSSTNIAAASAVTVKSFKLADPVNNHSPLSPANNKNYAIAKDGSFDSGYKSMPPVYSELTAAKLAQTAETEATAAPAPFSQFTLRKTGLKDKILADSTARNITKPEDQKTTTVQLRSHNGEAQSRYSVPVFTAPAKLPKPIGHVSKTDVVSRSPPPPPAPAMAAPSFRVVKTQRSLPPVLVDSRDQLLEAIRSFGQNGGLKKKK